MRMWRDQTELLKLPFDPFQQTCSLSDRWNDIFILIFIKLKTNNSLDFVSYVVLINKENRVSLHSL